MVNATTWDCYTWDVEKPDPDPIDSATPGNPEEVADRARLRADDLDREFTDRLSSLDSRMTANRARHEAAKTKANKDSMSDPDSARGLGVGLTVAYAIIGTPMILFLIGMGVDRLVGIPSNATLKWSAALGLLGMFMGVAFAIIVANRAANR